MLLIRRRYPTTKTLRQNRWHRYKTCTVILETDTLPWHNTCFNQLDKVRDGINDQNKKMNSRNRICSEKLLQEYVLNLVGAASTEVDNPVVPKRRSNNNFRYLIIGVLTVPQGHFSRKTSRRKLSAFGAI
jgi:hypothetical protein